MTIFKNIRVETVYRMDTLSEQVSSVVNLDLYMMDQIETVAGANHAANELASAIREKVLEMLLSNVKRNALAGKLWA